MKQLLQNLRNARVCRDTRGGMAEYIILTVVIAVGAIAVSKDLRTAIQDQFTTTQTEIGNLQN